MAYGWGCRTCGALVVRPDIKDQQDRAYRAMLRQETEHTRRTGHSTVGNPAGVVWMGREVA